MEARVCHNMKKSFATLGLVSSVCVHSWINEYDHCKISSVTWVGNLHIDTFCLSLVFL